MVKLPAADQKLAEAITNIPGYDAEQGQVVIVLNKGECGCGCGQPVEAKSRFRQGHDMKLVSILKQAYLTATSIYVADYEGTGHGGEAPVIAGWYGGAFPAKLAKSIESAKARQNGGRNTSAKKAADKIAASETPAPAPADAPRMAKGKVGRWVYEGTIEGDEFYYTNAKDDVVRVPLERVKIISE